MITHRLVMHILADYLMALMIMVLLSEHTKLLMMQKKVLWIDAVGKGLMRIQ